MITTLLKYLILIILVLPGIGNTIETAEDREKKQAELDFECERARQIALAPQKLQVYKECLEKDKGDEDYCLKQGDEYNGTRINGSPQFYDLPECQAAFKYKKSYRNRD